MEKKSSLRGWLILLSCIIVTFVFQGLISSQQGLFLEPVTNSLGISRSLYSTLDAFTQTFNLICSLSFAVVIGKIGISKVVKIGAWGTVVYCFGMYLAGSFGVAVPLLIGVAQASLGVFLGWTSVVCISVLLNNWFAKNRGTIIGITQAASGLGGTVFTSIVQKMIINSGWQMAMVFRGVLCAVGALAICIIVKAKPGKNEKRVWEDEAEEEKDDSNAIKEGLLLQDAMRTRQFWLLVVFFFLSAVVINSPLSCMAAFATDAGHVEHIGSIMTVLFGVCVVSQLGSGVLFEKIGSKFTLIPALIVLAVMSFLLSNSTPSLKAFYAAAICLGLGWFIWTVAVPMVTIEYFGEKDFGRIQSLLFASCMLGAIIGYPVFNIVYDKLGSYSYDFKANIIICLLMIVVLLLCNKSKKAD